MYYQISIGNIRSVIKKSSPYTEPAEATLVKGMLPPLSHLLWMCDEIEKMDTTSLDLALKAGRWIGWVFAYLEMHAILSNTEIRDMVRADREKNKDRPH